MSTNLVLSVFVPASRDGCDPTILNVECNNDQYAVIATVAGINKEYPYSCLDGALGIVKDTIDLISLEHKQ